MLYKKGFTLAEVLITLAVIGIVAALTMPALIGNYQKKVWVMQLRKTYNVLANGLDMIKADEGEDNLSDTQFYSDRGISTVDGHIRKHFNVIKSCTSDDNDCKFSDYKALNGEKPNGPPTFGSSGNYYFFLNDGSIIGMLSPTGDNLGKLIDFVVDVNGTKPPNQYGRDVFRFAYAGNKLEAWHCNGTDGAPCVTTNQGWECAKKIIEDGWEMNY
ncbi:MAG: type II secretion system GspH family protein [Heliobacteriaceae bacterium]|nr:type II secretion system GspH family protein [Heliobacteriaceae bacterium]